MSFDAPIRPEPPRQDARDAGGDDGADRREVVFLLSPRVIDFDTFLPTAIQLKALRPGWTIRFVTFSRKNADFILRNPLMVEGLRRCGTLEYLGSETAGGRLSRMVRRVSTLARLTGWVLRRRRPVLLMSRPFTGMPYNLLYALAMSRGGKGILLWKSRSPDIVHHQVWKVREKPEQQPLPWANRLLGRDCDALVHYHEDQSENVELTGRYGRVSVPWLRIGFPHLFPAWRALVEDESARERAALTADGVPADAELYSMFAAKPYSAETLRDPEAIQRVFIQALTTLVRLRPKAVVLIRPHPLAIDAAYIQEAMAAVGADHARLSFAHPEVLIALSRRAIFNNPTNVMFSCYDGPMLDVSDYPDDHHAEFGARSLAHGYGPVYVDPRGDDFADRFAAALNDDGLFDDPALTDKRDALLAANPPTLTPLLDLLRP